MYMNGIDIQDDELDRRIDSARNYFLWADELGRYLNYLEEGSKGRDIYVSAIRFFRKEGAKEIVGEEHADLPTLERDGIKDLIYTLKKRQSGERYGFHIPFDSILGLLERNIEYRTVNSPGYLATDLFIQICDVFVELDPENTKERIKAYKVRANLRSKLGKSSDAVSDFDRTIELAEDLKNKYGHFLEEISELLHLYNLRGTQKYNSGDFEGSIEDFDKVIELHDKHSRVHQLGERYDYSYVWIKSYKADAYTHMGLAKMKLGRNEQAIDDFNKSLELVPYDSHSITFLESNGIRISEEGWKSLDVLLYRSYAKIELGKFQEAIDDLEMSIDINTKMNIKHRQHYLQRAYAKFRLGRFEDAIADLDKEIEFNPNSSSYGDRGYVKVELGRFEEALVDFERAAEFGMTDHHLLGFLKLKLGREDEAFEHFNEQIRTEPLPNSYSWRASIFERRGQIEPAREDYRMVLNELEKVPKEKLHKKQTLHLVRSVRGLLR